MQRVYDNLVMAYRIGEHKDVMLPVMICQDGFITSHAVENINLLEDKEVKDFVGEYEPENYLLNPECPMAVGPYSVSNYYFEAKRAQAEALKISKQVVLAVAKEYKTISGREYGLFEEYKMEDAEEAVVIIGSDRRGTIYGIYELSEQIGVSPWYWWADVPIRKQQNVYVKPGQYTDGEPAVTYRGIFLNDEAPCLTGWVKQTYGTNYGDHRFYAQVCELILRLKGNFLWPAMWSWAFYADDPQNSKTASEMGVIIGTSHHEP